MLYTSLSWYIHIFFCLSFFYLSKCPLNHTKITLETRGAQVWSWSLAHLGPWNKAQALCIGLFFFFSNQGLIFYLFFKLRLDFFCLITYFSPKNTRWTSLRAPKTYLSTQNNLKWFKNTIKPGKIFLSTLIYLFFYV